MADLYGFKDKAIAEQLKLLAEQRLKAHTNMDHPKGSEVRLAKLDEALPAAQEDDGDLVVGAPKKATVTYFGETGSNLESEDYTLDVYNTTKTSYQSGENIQIVRHREQWIVLEKPAGAADAKRMKFKLLESLVSEGNLQSGFAYGEVIDPMNSGLEIGFEVNVYDYKYQFVTAGLGCIGIASLGDPYGDGEVWHIEEVEQLVHEMEGDAAESIAAWTNANTITLTNVKASSSWPYVVWDYGEAESVEVNNERRFTAIPCRVRCKRVIPDAYLPRPDNQVCPYTLSPLVPFWTITSVEKPIARWIETVYESNKWVIVDTAASSGDPGGQFAEGYNPLLSSHFTAGDDANPPTAIWQEIQGDGLNCMIKEGSAGWAFLDDNAGLYVTVSSASSMFGTPNKVAMVGKIDALDTDKLIDASSECGEFKHEHLINTLVWGNPEGSGTGCTMENTTPQPVVDVFGDAAEVEVITGIQTDANGDLELVKSTIKACESTASSSTLSLSQVDVVTDVACDVGGFKKSYKTIKYLGSELSSGAVVIDTSCIEIDYTQIINYPDYPYIDYYDIIWPNGCNPCESTGCCTVLYQGDYLTGADGISESACDALELSSGGDSSTWVSGASSCPTGAIGCCTGGSENGNDTTQGACYLGGGSSWDAGATCGGGGPCDCCVNLTVTNVYLGGIESYDSDYGSSIAFDAGAITKSGDGCTWDIDGMYGGDWGFSAAGSCTVSYDDATLTWSVFGTVPAPAGGSFSGSLVVDSCVTPPTPDQVIIIPVTGTHVGYSGGPESFSGGFNFVWNNTCN